jgi:DNA-binding MarR family transcriptional regulator
MPGTLSGAVDLKQALAVRQITSYGLTHDQFFLIIAVMKEEGLLPSELADKTARDRIKAGTNPQKLTSRLHWSW